MTLHMLVMDRPGKRRYSRLADVFYRSVKDVQPNLKIRATTRVAPDPGREPYKPNVTAFLEKLRQWNAWVRKAEEPIVLADCDMLMTNPVTAAPKDADIWFTVRLKPSTPINTGIVFVKPSKASRRFFEQWLTIYESMLEDFDLYMKWAPTYAGGDQAALGCVLKTMGYEAKIGELPCHVWNATQTEWDQYDPATTRFVHIKSDLRKLCLGEDYRMRAPATRAMEAIAKRWRVYDKE